MLSPSAHPAADPSVPADRVLVAGSSPRMLDMLRLATLRSDDVTVIATALDDKTRRYAEHFAVEWLPREPAATDVSGYGSLLVATEAAEAANGLVRAARRAGVPVHVLGRPLVSDFSMMEFLEGRVPAPTGALPAASP